MTSKVLSKSQQLHLPLTDVGCGLWDNGVPGSGGRMCALWGVVYPVWIVAAVSRLDLLFKRLPNALLRCNPCTVPSACLRSMNIKMDMNLSSHNFLWRISQVFIKPCVGVLSTWEIQALPPWGRQVSVQPEEQSPRRCRRWLRQNRKEPENGVGGGDI